MRIPRLLKPLVINHLTGRYLYSILRPTDLVSHTAFQSIYCGRQWKVGNVQMREVNNQLRGAQDQPRETHNQLREAHDHRGKEMIPLAGT